MPNELKNCQNLSSTFVIVPMHVLFINFVVVPHLLLTHFMKYIGGYIPVLIVDLAIFSSRNRLVRSYVSV